MLVFDHYGVDHFFIITESSMVFCSDSEKVLGVLSQSGNCEVDKLSYATLDPLLLAFLQSFHHIANNSAASILLWFSPSQTHTLLGHISDTQLWWWAWFFWRRKQRVTLVLSIAVLNS